MFSEIRSLRVVAAVTRSVVVEDQTIDFLIEEEETNYNLDKDEYQVQKGDFFPHQKLLRLTLKGMNKMWPNVLIFFDDAMKVFMKVK